MAVVDAYVFSSLSHSSTNTTFLSKATDYFSHMLLQRWEAKINWKEKSPKPGNELTTTRSWVRHAHHWATRAGHRDRESNRGVMVVLVASEVVVVVVIWLFICFVGVVIGFFFFLAHLSSERAIVTVVIAYLVYALEATFSVWTHETWSECLPRKTKTRMSLKMDHVGSKT